MTFMLEQNLKLNFRTHLGNEFKGKNWFIDVPLLLNQWLRHVVKMNFNTKLCLSAFLTFYFNALVVSKNIVKIIQHVRWRTKFNHRAND